MNEKILPRETEFPPLLKEFLVRESNNPDVKLKLSYLQTPDNFYRIAKEGETPTEKFIPGLGIPKSPNLYKTVKFDE